MDLTHVWKWVCGRKLTNTDVVFCKAKSKIKIFVSMLIYLSGIDFIKFIIICRRYLYEKHPTLGLSLLRMAKLSWFLEKEIEAKAFIAEAKAILDITHGPNSPFFLKNVVPLIREIALSTEFKRAMGGCR